MNPQFAEILAHPTDTVAIVKPESFTVVECNFKFIVVGTCVFDVLDCNVSQEKKKEICSQVTSNGYCIADYKGSLGRLHFNRIKVGSEDFCVVRVTTQTNATQQYQSLFEKNVAGVFRTSIQGQVLSCNIAFARMLGYASVEDVLFVNAETFYPNKNDRSSFIEALRHGGVVTNFEITLRRKDGVVITGLENTYLEIESDGSEVIIGTIIDISHQKKIEKELLER
jgi:PAS domain S-box-containing protein